MDLDLWRRLSLRLFEADWVWANHNFANEVGPAFPGFAASARKRGSVCALVWFSSFGYPDACGSGGELLDPAQRSHGG